MQDAQNAPVKYASVNGAWPENLPPLSDHEAMSAARRLYRMAHNHAWIEREMIEHVVKSGWLEGKLKRAQKPVKPEPTAKERTAARLLNIDDRIKRWERKHRRAETALTKLNRQRRRLERSMAA